ncbi:recombinase RecJ [Halobacteriales archaeon QH_1_68_42]|nr:MAG: recombinase RecJ [Halobacteriales archaeon QH_1_68_42]
MTDGPVPDLAGRARECAERLLAAEEVLLASHIDADGLTSAAVASTALSRAGLPHEVVFKKQLDETEIATIAAREYDTVLFTDFGSGQLDDIGAHEDAGDFEPVIADHHQPADRETRYHLNPLLAGIDGASELSGAGAAYVLARALADESGQPGLAEADAGAGPADASGETGAATNRDLAALAVVGAVGDMQAVGGELVGANTGIVDEGVEAGVLAEGTDLSLYGKQTRPLPKLFEYATDVQIPGALVRRAVKRGVPADKIDSLVGTTYELVAEPEGTELRDASEFSTLLNATARYERADVGLGVCLGGREDALERARRLLANHRRNLSEGLEYVRREGVTHEDNLQWFDAGDAIRETIVGIVAGMALGTDGVSPDKPIVAFASKDEEETKVSARGSGVLVRQGLDLSVVMREASRTVGGDGGGHDIAAGATVPAGREGEFVAAANDVLAEQLG